MRNITKRLVAVSLTVMLLLLAAVPAAVVAQTNVQHGIGFTKGCTSPVKIGDPYTCSYTVRNVLDEAEDTLMVDSLSDVVHAAGGDVNSGEILGAVQIDTYNAAGTLPTGSFCTATGGTGTPADPYTGVTDCTMPFGSRLNIHNFSFYTVQAADFNLPNHQLRDEASLGWNDLCDDPAGTGNSNCDPTPPNQGASSLSLIQQLESSTTTDIHNAAHQVVLTVAAGSTVHDLVTVTGQPGEPVPTGTVNIDWFENGDCSGTPEANSGSVGPLDASGQFDATGFSQGPLAAGLYSFMGHYEGDPNNPVYTASDGPCEPLAVVDARISIAATDTNEVGNAHTFTATVWINDGTGETLAPDGTDVTFTSVDSDGAVSTPNPPTGCSTTAGSCTTTINSTTTGTTEVTAHTTVTVAGLALSRSTDGTGANSDPAEKTWVDARIAITPNDTNEVGNSHTFTATVWVDPGDGEVLAPDGTLVTFTSVDSDGAVSTPNPPTQCNTTGGSCTTVINSNATGTTTVTAHTTVTVGGVQLTRQTDDTGNNSDPASKTWVDARITIAPNDTNEVGNAHTFTVTVWVDPGDGEVPAPNGTLVTFTSVDSDGAVSTPNPPTSCMTSGGTGTCTTVINSNATGTTTVTAHTTVTVGGVPLTRHTDSSLQNSGPASKTWVDASIGIVPNGNNPVNSTHTFTVTVKKDPGNGLVAAAGETVTTSIVNSAGATATMVGGTCGDTSGTSGSGLTDASGQCTVVITSPTAGTTTAYAYVTLTVGGVSLTRDADSQTATGHGPEGTDEAVKTWFSPSPSPTGPDTAATGSGPINGDPSSSSNLILLLILGALAAAVLLIRPALRTVRVQGGAGSRNSRRSRTDRIDPGSH